MKLLIPGEITVGNVVPLIRRIGRQVPGTEIELDFSQVTFARPAGTLYLARELRALNESSTYDLIIKKPTGLLRAAHTYLDHINFWRYLNNDDFGSATPSSRYLPLTKISFEHTDLSDYLANTKIHKKIETESYNLANVISGNDETADGVNRTLSYGLCEIIRNALEHAEVNECIVSGQKWGNGFAEIVIADMGIGVPESLRKAIPEIGSSDNALGKALQPGVSSKLAADDDDNPWANDGFGLFMLSKFGSTFGHFMVISGGRAVVVNEEGQEFSSAPIAKGTLVALRIRTDSITSEKYRAVKAKIVAEGRSIIEESGSPIREVSQSLNY